MRLLAQSFPISLRRGPLFAVDFFVFAMIAAYELAGYIIHNDITSLAFVAMALVGGAFVVAMLNNWRNGLYFFLAYRLTVSSVTPSTSATFFVLIPFFFIALICRMVAGLILRGSSTCSSGVKMSARCS